MASVGLLALYIFAAARAIQGHVTRRTSFIDQSAETCGEECQSNQQHPPHGGFHGNSMAQTTSSRASPRRLTLSELQLGALTSLSVYPSGGMAVATLSENSVAIALEDYGNGRRGALYTCDRSGGDVLDCERRGEFSADALHYEDGSLAMAALEEDAKVLIAWKQGVSPYRGQIQWFSLDLEDNGIPHSINVEMGFVAVTTLSENAIVFAYSDARRNHEGSVVYCAVENENLNCQLPSVFEKNTLRTLALAPLTDGSSYPPYFIARTSLLVAYEVEIGLIREGRVQVCVADIDQARLQCHSRNLVKAILGRSAGISVLALSSTYFVVGYADRSQVCPTPSTRRRRSLDVCTLDDGHPSIGRLRLCQAITSSEPFELTCREFLTTVDDGYDTGLPRLARGTDAQTLITAYLCNGCDDEGARALLRHCEVVPAAGPLPFEISCGNATVVNNFTTTNIAVASTVEGYVVVYDDYGNRTFVNIRYITP